MGNNLPNLAPRPHPPCAARPRPLLNPPTLSNSPILAFTTAHLYARPCVLIIGREAAHHEIGAEPAQRGKTRLGDRIG